MKRKILSCIAMGMSLMAILPYCLTAGPLNQTVSGSTVFTASTAVAYQSMINNPVIGLEITVTGSGAPVAVTGISLDASLCTNFTTDVSMVRVYYTGSDSAFAITNQFWAGYDPSQTLTGNQMLSPGKNYFWISFDVFYYAIVGDILDAAINWFTLSDFTGLYLPDVSSPPGHRLVAAHTPVPRSISGRVMYDNQAETGLNNVLLLLNSGYNAQQTTTGSNGQFQFNNLMPGTYQIVAICYKPWGGVNAVDALGILRYFVGVDPLSPLQQMAADVDASYFINSTDALLVLKRFTGIINYFPLGDWVFEPTMVVVDGTGNIVRNIKGLCVGDVNRSYVP